MGRWSYQFRMWYLLVSQTFFMVSKKKSSCIFKLLFFTLIQHGFFFCGEVGVLPNQPNRWNHHWKVFSTQDWKRRSYNGRYGSEAPLKLEPLKAAGLWRVWIAMDKGPPDGVQYSILAVENCDEHILWKLLPNYLDPCRLGNWLLLCADHFNEHWSKCNNSMSLTSGHFGWGLNLIQINQVFSARDPQKLRAQTHLNQSTRYFSVQAVTPCAEW